MKILAHLVDSDLVDQVEKLKTAVDRQTAESGGGPGGSGSGSGSAGIRLPDVAKGHIDLTGEISEELARSYLPKVAGATISKDVTWHFRWKAAYPTHEEPFCSTKTWLKEGTEAEVLESCKHSLVYVLSWCWDCHEKKSGQACPYVFT